MKQYLLLAAFLILAITGVNAQDEVHTSEEKTELQTMVGFKGEFITDKSTTFSLNMAGDTFNLKVNEKMIFVSMSNRRILPFQGLDAIVYTIDNVSLDGMDWEEFLILDVSTLSDKEKEAYTGGVATSRDHILFISGSPMLKLLCDLDYGKLAVISKVPK